MLTSRCSTTGLAILADHSTRSNLAAFFDERQMTTGIPEKDAEEHMVLRRAAALRPGLTDRENKLIEVCCLT